MNLHRQKQFLFDSTLPQNNRLPEKPSLLSRLAICPMGKPLLKRAKPCPRAAFRPAGPKAGFSGKPGRKNLPTA